MHVCEFVCVCHQDGGIKATWSQMDISMEVALCSAAEQAFQQEQDPSNSGTVSRWEREPSSATQRVPSTYLQPLDYPRRTCTYPGRYSIFHLFVH